MSFEAFTPVAAEITGGQHRKWSTCRSHDGPEMQYGNRTESCFCLGPSGANCTSQCIPRLLVQYVPGVFEAQHILHVKKPGGSVLQPHGGAHCTFGVRLSIFGSHANFDPLIRADKQG